MPIAAIDGTVVGRLTGLVNISGSLATTQTVTGEISNAGVIYKPIPAYEGEYEVDPMFTKQTLATKDLRMTDDVTVNAIEVQTVSNPSGGNTVYIGGLINYG